MAARVVISHLCKSFGALEAVKDISFEVEQGEVLGFLGPNGAGKSTTMKMVTGFLKPTSGTATVCGFDVREQPLEVKRRIGYLPEGAPSYGEMTPRGFLEFVAGVRGYQGVDVRQRAERARGLAQLEDVWDQRIETLSKGFKRRVGIAQAILHDPEVLILDEPTDGLDPNQKHEVRDLIREMGKDKVIILSTHILEEVDAVCTRAIIIAHGQVKADGTPAQLHEHAWGGPALTVGVKAATAAEVGALLQGIEGVKHVEALASSNGLQRFRVTASPGCDVAAAVGRSLASQPWELDELSPERSGLDRVFRQVTTGGSGA